MVIVMAADRTDQNPDLLISVEYLRGLAALFVTWFHLTNTYSPNWVQQSGAFGWLGVEAFFVISGFIIPYALHRSAYTLKDFPSFILRRVVRLEPPYIISIFLVLLLWELSARAPGFAGASPSYELPQIAAHLFYIIPFTSYSWINVVYWTLAYEFGFYISAGLLWPILSKQKIWLTLAVFLIIFAIFRLPLIFLFLIGISGVRYFLKIDSFINFLLVTLVSVLMLYCYNGLAVVIVGLLSITIIVFSSFPRLWILGILGEISYSLYLIHVPVGGRVVNLGRRFVDSAPLEFVLSITALAICIASSLLYWRFIEAPAKRLAKRIRIGKPRAPTLSVEHSIRSIEQAAS